MLVKDRLEVSSTPHLELPASLVVAATILATLVSCGARSRPKGPTDAAENAGAPTLCRRVDIAAVSKDDSDARAADARVDEMESSALALLDTELDEAHRILLLGKLLLNDKNLSVNKTQACASCHDTATGFTNPVSLFNDTIVAHPGDVPITNASDRHPNMRIARRKPPSYSYAPFSPILHYNAQQQDFYGGNFWDMDAPGIRLDNPAAEQAQAPFVNPVEMALPDVACVVHRVAQSRYRALFERVWGAQSFAIHWPEDVEQVCAKPGPAPKDDPLPVHLSAVERGIMNGTFDHLALAIASYEASPEVSPFSSKFDRALRGGATLTAQEERGWELFRGKAKCNTCHLDGTASEAAGRSLLEGEHGAPADVAPLFTDFTAANLGIPKNPCLPYYEEDVADQHGFVANPAGAEAIDRGVGGFLAGAKNPNPSEWASLAPEFEGKFLTQTLRNVDKRPRPDFVKAYMHNGYLKSLKEVVHFYNTSQALPRCDHGAPGEKVSCWPPPEVPVNVETETVGDLGLSSEEEDAIVSFLRTLTDEYVTAFPNGRPIPQ